MFLHPTTNVIHIKNTNFNFKNIIGTRAGHITGIRGSSFKEERQRPKVKELHKSCQGI